MDSSLSSFSKFIKIPNFLPQFIVRFDQIFNEFLKNTLILRGFNHYPPLYSLICDYFSKLVSLVIIFDASLRVFKNLVV